MYKILKVLMKFLSVHSKGIAISNINGGSRRLNKRLDASMQVSFDQLIFHDARILTKYDHEISRNIDRVGQLSGTYRAAPCRSRRLSWPRMTYREGDSFDRADGVTAIARIAGAAQYLVTIHIHPVTCVR